MAQFECAVMVIHHFQDSNNYPDTTEEWWTEAADSLEALYERLAAIRRDRVQGEVARYGEYTTVTFEPIRHIEVLETYAVEEARLGATAVWQAHHAAVEAKRRVAEAEVAATTRQRMIAQEAEERRQLAALLAKYRPLG